MEEAFRFSKRKVLQGSALIGGTAIGAGMLALPIASAQAGFLPAIFVYVVCWLFSLITGLLMLEVSMKMPKNANLISMAGKYLGPVGKAAAWILYIFLFYSLTLAYVTAGGNAVASVFKLPHLLGMLIFTTVFGGSVYLGHRATHRINVALMVGLVLSYILFIVMGVGHVEVDLLKHVEFKYMVMALPIVFTSFSYQGTVPSLVTYLNHNRKMARLSIIIGSTLPFAVYIVWDLLIKGIIPVDGLLAAKAAGLTAVDPLRQALPGAPITLVGLCFGFFAVTTSFLGVSMGLFDFLSDGLKMKQEGWRRLFLIGLVYLPPMAIAMVDPSIFFKALEYAGGIGCVLLLGLIPVMMVWMGRYVRRDMAQSMEVAGGRVLLAILVLFMLFEVGVTIS